MLAHVLDDWLHTQCECGYDCYVCIAAERLNNVERWRWHAYSNHSQTVYVLSINYLVYAAICYAAFYPLVH